MKMVVRTNFSNIQNAAKKNALGSVHGYVSNLNTRGGSRNKSSQLGFNLFSLDLLEISLFEFPQLPIVVVGSITGNSWGSCVIS